MASLHVSEIVKSSGSIYHKRVARVVCHCCLLRVPSLPKSVGCIIDRDTPQKSVYGTQLRFIILLVFQLL